MASQTADEIMTQPMTDEDRELNILWRQMFGQPLPILGAADVARQVLMRLAQSGSQSVVCEPTT